VANLYVTIPGLVGEIKVEVSDAKDALKELTEHGTIGTQRWVYVTETEAVRCDAIVKAEVRTRTPASPRPAG
jgi:hypothetical protein